MKLPLTAPLAALLALVAACGPSEPDTVFSSATNPPAAYCLSKGGAYSAGSCTLPSGDVVDAAQYYRDTAGR